MTTHTEQIPHGSLVFEVEYDYDRGERTAFVSPGTPERVDILSMGICGSIDMVTQIETTVETVDLGDFASVIRKPIVDEIEELLLERCIARRMERNGF